MKIYKGYQIKPSKEMASILQVVTDGKGGKVPNCLTSLFTSVNEAVKTIDAYLLTRDAKNAKDRAEGGV